MRIKGFLLVLVCVFLVSCVSALNCGGNVACNCGDMLIGSRVLNESDELVDCPGTGLIVGTDDLVLDCNGRIISGNLTGRGIWVSGKKNVIVRNCSVEDFDMGIYFGSSTLSNILESNSISDNVRYGVYISDGEDFDIIGNSIEGSDYGILAYLDNSHVSYNTIYNNLIHGIYLVNGWGNEVNNNEAYENGNGGIHLVGGGFNEIYDNDAYHNWRQITIVGASNNEVYGNNVWGGGKSGEHGIMFVFDTWNNTAYDNVIRDLSFGLLYETHTYDSLGHGNLIEDCGTGIYILHDVDRVEVWDNVLNNNYRGIYLLDAVDDNIVRDNVINGSGGFGVLVEEFTTSDYIGGVPSGNKFYRNEITGYDTAFKLMNSTDTEVVSNVLSDIEDYDFDISLDSFVSVLDTGVDKGELNIDGGSELLLEWYLNLNVVNEGGALEGVLVSISDNFGEEVFLGETDLNGEIPLLELREVLMGSGWEENYTPHLISLEKDGYVSEVIELVMDSSQSLEIFMERTVPADFDRDGDVDGDDLVHMNECLCSGADVNGDSWVNVVDGAYVARRVGCDVDDFNCGKCNLNGDTQLDFTDMALAFRKVGCVMSESSCEDADLNGDGYVNLADWDIFEIYFS